MKKFAIAMLSLAMAFTCLTGCGAQNNDPSKEKTNEKSAESKPAESTPDKGGVAEAATLKVAALESAYGVEGWKKVAKAFEETEKCKVDLVTDKNIEDVINPSMEAGDYPDVIACGVGRPSGLTEKMIKSNGLLDLSDVLEMQIPGESVKVSDKLLPGFTDNSIVRPYQDGKLFLMPTFYGPCGLFYDANLMKTKGWEVPKTFEKFFALGEKAQAEGVSLFAYPTTGYFDAFFYGLCYEAGGREFFDKVTHYAEGIWDTAEGKQVLETIYKLSQMTDKSVPANANKEGYKNNQSLILEDKAIFMPNGTWVVGEMADAQRADGFAWGFTALPALKDGGDQYSYTFFEQAWAPKEAKNTELAKKFLAFLYSDKAVDAFLTSGENPAVQPVKNVEKKLQGDNQLFYSVYAGGAKAAVGNFAATNPVEGVNIADTMFGSIDSLVTGDLSLEAWTERIKADFDALRPALQ